MLSAPREKSIGRRVHGFTERRPGRKSDAGLRKITASSKMWTRKGRIFWTPPCERQKTRTTKSNPASREITRQELKRPPCERQKTRTTKSNPASREITRQRKSRSGNHLRAVRCGQEQAEFFWHLPTRDKRRGPRNLIWPAEKSHGRNSYTKIEIWQSLGNKNN
jgi:hypothetical protein